MVDYRTQAAESVKMETTAGRRQQSGFILQQQTVFQHTQNPHSHAYIREWRGLQGTLAITMYNQISPLDHKMADNWVSLTCTNTLSSTITKLIKT